jgi:hypothetical protein
MLSPTPNEGLPNAVQCPEDDHDVLTFREAVERLQHEIALQQQRVAALTGTPEQEAARARLEQLEAAAVRQDAARRAAYDRSAFFGSAD